MLRVVASLSMFFGLISAQESPDWTALLEILPVDESAMDVADAISEMRPVATSMTASLTGEERAKVFLDGLREHDIVNAIAVLTLLDDEGRDLDELEPRVLYEHVFSCQALVASAARSNVQSSMLGQGGTPAWLQKAREPALAHGRAAMERLLRLHPSDTHTHKAISQCWVALLPKTLLADPRHTDLHRQAVELLGEAAGVGDWMGVTFAMLRARKFDAARVALAAARTARWPFSLGERERMFDKMDDAAQWLLDATTLRADASDKDESPLEVLQQAVMYRADDIEERARAMLDAGVEHALPEVVLAWESFLAGRRDDAVARVERASSLPGADLRVVVLRLLVSLPELRQRLIKSPDDLEAELAMERMRSEIDATLGDDDDPVSIGARVLLVQNYGQALSDQSPAQRFAETLVNARRSPVTKQEYILGLIGASGAFLAGQSDSFELALRFLQLPVDAALAQHPLIMRQRASVATVIAAHSMIREVAAEEQREARALAAQARKHSRELGDLDWAAYLEMTERWVAARGEKQEQEVLADVGALEVARMQDGAWYPGSTALVMGLVPGVRFDQPRYMSLRTVTRTQSPSALIPLAVRMMVTDSASAQSLFKQLRGVLQSGKDRNILAVAEIAGGAPEAVAAARARSVLANGDWSESRARTLARGFYTTGEMRFGFSMVGMRPQLDCNFECTPIMLPKLKVATRLKGLARQR